MEKKCSICNGAGWIKIIGVPGITGGCCFECNKKGKRPKPPPDTELETVPMSMISGPKLKRGVF